MISAVTSPLRAWETSPAAPSITPAPTTRQADFASVLAKVAGEAVDTMKGAEAVSLDGVQGRASTQAVVEAVMSAERTLQTAVALRDKAVNAYLELSRMAI